MNIQYTELIQFYAQKFNVPIELVSQPWQLECLDKHQVIVGLPEDGSDHRVIGDMIVAMNPDFGKCVGGDLIVVEDVTVARMNDIALVLLLVPKNPTAKSFVRRLIDEQLPKVCKQFRKTIRDQMIEKYSGCVADRKRELLSSLREDDFELDRISNQLLTLSRRIETDRQLLRMFEKSPDFIKARATRCYFDLLKLVPGTYRSFHFSGDSIFGETHEIVINYEDFDYQFDPFTIECNMRTGEILISGGTPCPNGDYLHPHVASPDNICWGSCGHLVSRYAGSLDLYELYLLIHQFLSSYNENDPFKTLRAWGENWSEDDESEEPYCEFCDDYGHTVGDCDWCFWCEDCQAYVDHSDEDCPNRPKDEEEEVVDATAEL